jgi:hypothetical protein
MQWQASVPATTELWNIEMLHYVELSSSNAIFSLVILAQTQKITIFKTIFI